MRNQTVAVTGAGGFLGGRLVDRLAAIDCRIIRLGRSPLPPVEATATARVTDVIGDVTDRGAWDRLIDADIIFHFAAQTSGAAAASNPDADFRANVAPIRHLLAACRESGRRPIVLFAGTVTEAGVPSRLPVNEDAPDDPITIYDRHKLMAEGELKAATLAGAVRATTLRLANVYGPGARGRAGDRDVLNRMIRAALAGQPLTVYGHGGYVRDYLFIDDVIEAFLLAAVQPEHVSGRHYVIGSGSGVTIREAFELIAARVRQTTGRTVPVALAEPAQPLSPIEQRSFIADPGRFSAATGWQPAWSLCSGIDRTIEAFTCE
jgi:nucleoside-diphosphate-sugar epimerase